MTARNDRIAKRQGREQDAVGLAKLLEKQLKKLIFGVVAIASVAIVVVVLFPRTRRVEPAASPRLDASPSSAHVPPVAPVTRPQPAVVRQPATVRNNGLPISLAEFPRTPEFEQGMKALRESHWNYPGNVEGLVDYYLRFQDRLQSCLGDSPVSGGDITWEVLFQPPTDSDGNVPSLESANYVTVRKEHGLSEANLTRLAECGPKAAYGLPLNFNVMPTEPDYHLFVFLKFPITEDSFPYKVLRTGRLK